MLRQKFIIFAAAASMLVTSMGVGVLARDHKKKAQATFKVRIDNISNAGGLTAADGSKYPFALSPGIFVLGDDKMEVFRAGKKADAGLEAQAEDGDPSRAPAWPWSACRRCSSFGGVLAP